MEPRLVAVGALLLFVSSVVLIGTRALAVGTPLYLVSGATLVLAAASWAAGRPKRSDPA